MNRARSFEKEKSTYITAATTFQSSRKVQNIFSLSLFFFPRAKLFAATALHKEYRNQHSKSLMYRECFLLPLTSHRGRRGGGLDFEPTRWKWPADSRPRHVMRLRGKVRLSCLRRIRSESVVSLSLRSRGGRDSPTSFSIGSRRHWLTTLNVSRAEYP